LFYLVCLKYILWMPDVVSYKFLNLSSPGLFKVTVVYVLYLSHQTINILNQYIVTRNKNFLLFFLWTCCQLVFLWIFLFLFFVTHFLLLGNFLSLRFLKILNFLFLLNRLWLHNHLFFLLFLQFFGVGFFLLSFFEVIVSTCFCFNFKLLNFLNWAVITGFYG